MAKNSTKSTSQKTSTINVSVETPHVKEESKPAIVLCMCGQPWEPKDLGWGDGWLRCPLCGCL
jgi:hypothetical protein